MMWRSRGAALPPGRRGVLERGKSLSAYGVDRLTDEAA